MTNTNYRLGPLPWTDARVSAAYWKDFVATREDIREHPGFDLFERVQSLKGALRLFNNAADKYGILLLRFDRESRDGLLDRSRRVDLSALQDGLQEALYLFASAAMTLVDQSRAFAVQVTLPGYEERVAAFREDPEHRFVQELRVDVIHISMHRPEWEINYAFGTERGRTSRFLLSKDRLRRLNEYSAPARAYVMARAKGIDLGAMIEQYRSKVNGLHEWLHAAIDRACGKEIGDYLRVLRLIDGIAARSAWNIILSTFVKNPDRDPEKYMTTHLTTSEIGELRTLPPRSRTLVDRVIEMIDENGACDDKLRALAYKAFHVPEEADT